MSDPAREADARARVRAQREFERPLVIEAGAGTGKTAVLTSRLVSWALGPGWQRCVARRTAGGATAPTVSSESPDSIARDVLEGIAAITFTEAAAAEMAVRVEQALAGVEQGRQEPWLDETALPELAVRPERARALREALDHLTVSTIHAFCRTLLARFPIAAGLHPDFEIDATGRVQAEALQRVLESRLREEYERGGPLLDLAELEQGPSRILAALERLVAEGVRARELEADPLGGDRLESVARELRLAVGELRTFEAADVKLSAVPAAVFPLLGWLDEALATLVLDDLDGLEAFSDELRERWAGREKTLAEWGNGKSIATICKKLRVPEEEFRSASARAAQAFAVFLDLHPRRLVLAHEAFRELLADFESEMRRRSTLTFSDLLRGASDLVTGHPTIAAALRAELDLLLVDEFQDTDALQCELVRALALEGEPHERPSLFVVGDPKQSIYGWRNADLVAYDAFVRSIEQSGGERLSLCVNFRSVPPVLEEVERIIAPVMEEQQGVQPAFESLHARPDLCDAVGFSEGGASAVEHWVSWTEPEDPEKPEKSTKSSEATELEARAFAADVARLRNDHGVKLADVALLLRSRGDLDRYLRALRDVGVPYVVSGERSYFERREVMDAVAGLRCVLDPNDHVALLAFLRSATVGTPDAALIPLWAGDLPRLAGELHPSRPKVLEQIAGLVRGVAAGIPDGIPGIERIEGWEESLVAALAAIARLRESFERDAPDRFVERLRTELAIEVSEAGRFPAAFRVANLERLYREIASELAAGADEHAMLRRLRTAASRERETSEPVVAIEDAVRVMTVHGAKGLGFEHVYLAQVHKGSGNRGRDDGIERTEDGVEYRLVGTATPGFAAALDRRRARERAESVRTLYVALTRAKQRLVVMGSRRDDGPPDLAKAASAADWIAHRRDHPELVSLLQRGDPVREAGGASWRFLALDRPAAGTATSRFESSVERIVASAAEVWPALAARREAAAARMQRPLGGAASSLGHAALRDEVAERGFEPPVDPAEPAPSDARGAVGRGAARAIGTAVHALLEGWDLAAPAEVELVRQRARLPAVLTALGVDPTDAIPPARRTVLDEAQAILEGFAASPLFERFTSLGARVVGRELPVWLPPRPDAGPAEGAPLEGVAGAIDLVYRDADGGWVVVDYKSDRIGSARDLEDHALRYAPQGEQYVRALREGLGLETPPRFELWFLRTGDIATPLE